MSRLAKLSPQAIRAMFSSETDEQVITLLTIQDPTNINSPIRLADSYTQRLTGLTTDDEVVYGVVSRSNNYIFLPLEIVLPNEDDTGAGRCSISINYVTPEIIQLIRQKLTSPTNVNIELVLSSNTNYVEAEFPSFQIIGANYNAESISLDLDMIDYTKEPFPCYNFTPNYFPGLF